MCCSQMIYKVLLDNEIKIGWKMNFFNVGLRILKVLKDNKLTLLDIILSQMLNFTPQWWCPATGRQLKTEQ